MIYVDANYWIYWFEQSVPEHKYVLAPMRAAINEGIVMNYITLIEIAHYLRFLDPSEFNNRMAMIQRLSTLTLIDLDTSIVELALNLLVEFPSKGIGGRNAVILATMKENKIKKILTHDEAFKRIKGVKAIDTVP